MVLPVAAKELVFEKQQLSINNHILVVEVAKDDQQRQQGLMNRKELGQNHGMLFILDRSDRVCFWMKNTLIPLSIAFINEQKVITQIEDMQPMSMKNVCSHDKILYALEVNQGWFANNKIEKGMKIEEIDHSIP